MLKIKVTDLIRIVTHCRTEAPIETCGIVAGNIRPVNGALGKYIHTVYRCRNVLNSPTEYLIGAEEQLFIFQEIEKTHASLIGFYHSHPSDSRPSSIDKARSNYYGYSYLIVALQPINLTSWVLEDNGEFSEEAIHVI